MIKQPQRKPANNQVKLSDCVGSDLGALAPRPGVWHMVSHKLGSRALVTPSMQFLSKCDNR